MRFPLMLMASLYMVICTTMPDENAATALGKRRMSKFPKDIVEVLSNCFRTRSISPHTFSAEVRAVFEGRGAACPLTESQMFRWFYKQRIRMRTVAGPDDTQLIIDWLIQHLSINPMASANTGLLMELNNFLTEMGKEPIDLMKLCAVFDYLEQRPNQRVNRRFDSRTVATLRELYAKNPGCPFLIYSAAVAKYHRLGLPFPLSQKQVQDWTRKERSRLRAIETRSIYENSSSKRKREEVSRDGADEQNPLDDSETPTFSDSIFPDDFVSLSDYEDEITTWERSFIH